VDVVVSGRRGGGGRASLSDGPATDDPVVARRARIRALAGLARRAGYAFLALAVVGFAVAVAAGFPGPAVAATVVGLVAGCVILPPAIIVGYGVEKAAREDPAASGVSARRRSRR
jgi:hypothetical protein